MLFEGEHFLVFGEWPEVVCGVEFEFVGCFSEVCHGGDDGVADVLCVVGGVGVVGVAEDELECSEAGLAGADHLDEA